jgi:hypothetical protein
MPPLRRTPITDPNIWPLLGDSKLLDPPTQRYTWTNSRLVLRPDNSTIPLLHVIAEHVFGPWDPREYFPTWKDMDWTNESLDNVQLVQKSIPRNQRPVNKSGFPSGTPEYFKWYRQQHPEKVKQWAKDANARRKKQLNADQLELRRLRALHAQGLVAHPGFVRESPVEELMAPPLDFIDEYKARLLGGGSPTPPSSPLIQIGTPLEDDPEPKAPRPPAPVVPTVPIQIGTPLDHDPNEQ